MTARSRITAQGQISVPAEVRKRLGVGAGAVLVWSPTVDGYVVRRAASTSFAEAHAALGFAAPPARRSERHFREAIRARAKARHKARARR